MVDKDTSREERAETREDEGRAKRIPLGVPQPKLAAPTRPGYIGRWVNDHNGRIELAKQAGYTHVSDANGKAGRAPNTKRQVGTHPDGSPLLAYLMEIRQEFYNEDQAAKQAQVDEVDTQIKRGTPQGAEAQDQSAFYVPSEGITIKTEN